MKRTGWARRTGRLAAQSPKRRRTQAERRKMLAKIRSDICCAADLLPHIDCRGALDPHEPLTRARGGSITDPANLAWICRGHHDHIHDHPDEGHRVGLLVHSWERPKWVRRDAWCDICVFGYPDILLTIDGDYGTGECPEGHPIEMSFEGDEL